MIIPKIKELAKKNESSLRAFIGELQNISYDEELQVASYYDDSHRFITWEFKGDFHGWIRIDFMVIKENGNDCSFEVESVEVEDWEWE